MAWGGPIPYQAVGLDLAADQNVCDPKNSTLRWTTEHPYFKIFYYIYQEWFKQYCIFPLWTKKTSFYCTDDDPSCEHWKTGSDIYWHKCLWEHVFTLSAVLQFTATHQLIKYSFVASKVTKKVIENSALASIYVQQIKCGLELVGIFTFE